MKWLFTLVAALFRALLGWGQQQAEKPKTLTDAQTPETTRRAWDLYLRDRLRDKPDHRDRPEQ